NVSAWNNTLLNPPVFTALTGVNGLIVPRQNITEYIQNITGIYPATNYTINATKTGYNNASKQLNITESTLLTMALIDSCLPHPTDNWNITQNCVVDSREITLARDKNLTISSGGSLTLINTTLWINGSNNGTSIISVLSGGSMNITDKNGDGSLINSTARNNRRFAFIVNYSSSFAMTNSQLEEAGWVEALGKYGLEIRTTVARFEGNTIKNNYVGVLLSSNHNTIKSNSIDGNLLVGISIFTGNINNTLILNNITNNWYGVSLTAFSSNNYIISNNISNNGNGISLESTNNIFRDSNITNSVSKDIEVFGSGYNTFLNTPFNKTKVFFDSVSTGKIDVKWYLDLTVKNISSHLLQGANVTAFNRTLLQVFSELSGASGQISRKNITEYTQNITGVYYRTNYTLNSSLTAYRNYSQQLNVTKSMQFDIVLLKNIPPTVTLISPVDNFTTNNRTPTFNWSGFDADSDPLTYELNLTCFSIIGGGCSDDNRVISVGSSTSHTLSDYLRYLYDNFYYYNWSVRASDDTGVTWGSWSEIRKLNIQSLVSISLTNNEVKFGSMFPGESNDTLDDSPLPFILENTGNSFVNVSINATNLWFTQQNPTEYFKYKIDNITSEKGSFDWGRTNTSWRQVPGWITPTIAIVHFNWTDATDSAEININVTVPGGIEGAGSRNSYIYFTASFDEKDGGGGGPQI
ncbi:right-handed parallel beta-helix repeat-containing protein, partial [Candidatus Pacearchaeota archaeon]|nr:right-handed parallel beta-helix repeat-containing protein [Candidatus Pacearchaeota archaeon]